MRHARALTFAALAGLLLLSGCAPEGSPSLTEPAAETPAPNTSPFPDGSTMAEIATEGTIRIAIKTDQPLFGYQSGESAPEGFEVELGRIIAGELGIAEDGIEWVPVASADREIYLTSGYVDLVIATYTITEKREEFVAFAGPYYRAGQATLVLADDDSLSEPDALAGVEVCAAAGSTAAARLADLDAEVSLADTYSACLDALQEGEVDAVSTDNVILAGFVATVLDDAGAPVFALVEDGATFSSEPYGIGVNRGRADLVDWLDGLLETIAADGRYQSAWESTVGSVLPYVPLDR